MGHFMESAEEIKVVEADDLYVAFALNFQVFPGAHDMKEGTNS
jgi:hypothetical protein